VRAGADATGMAAETGLRAPSRRSPPSTGCHTCASRPPPGTTSPLDVGLDPADVIGALDAFADGEERCIDVGRVNGRAFVNNVAMGVYRLVVQSPEYRDHKVRTVINKLPELVGPGAQPFDLRFTGRDGRAYHTAVLLLVSNNPYGLDPRPQRGTRGDLDGGVLGVIALAGPPPRGLTEWSTPSFRVESAKPIAPGIDGESVEMAPPLIFEPLPSALRVRTPPRHRRR
jgi:diacylglycerol kinase family enzyme